MSPKTTSKASKAAPKKKLGATKSASPKKQKTSTKVLTREDFEINPNLIAEGYKVGDTVEVVDENDVEAAEAATKENKLEAPEKKADSVDVIKGDEFIRTYSEDLHGEGFLDLAKEFLGKSADYKLVSSDSIKALVVRYRALDKKTGVSYRTSASFTLANDGDSFKKKAVLFRNEKNGTVAIK